VPRVRKTDGIIISVTGYRWVPGGRDIRSSLDDKEYVKFISYMANELKVELVRAIDTQRYKKNIKKWPPLSIKYLQYKKRVGLSTNIWEATGNMRKNIKVFNRGSWLVVGFKKDDKYPSTDLTFNRVAKYVEYGGIKLPPRPLFREVAVYMRKNINMYYKRFRRDVLGK
jgi:hypothetical protein